jgi:cytochrome c oxidase subunit II
VQAFKVGLFAVVLGTIGWIAVYLTPSWFPPQASVQAVRHDHIYFALMIMASYIFAIVVSFLGYSMWVFRAKDGDMSDGEPIHGNTMLEIVWTVIPLVLVLGFAVYGAFVLSKNENTSNARLLVNVTGEEFEWRFDYPTQKVHSGILELPVNQKVVFKVHGLPKDVIHGFYIPAFREGIDAVPGEVTTLVATPDRVGSYNVICNMLCGIGHSQMRTVVNVVPQEKFAAWVHTQLHPPKPKPTSGPIDAKALFTTNCASCHTLSAAGSTGTIGPDLDNVSSDATKYGNGQSAEDYVRESIVDPDKVVVSGFPSGTMPPTFGTSLSSQQIDALVDFILKGNSG